LGFCLLDARVGDARRFFAALTPGRREVVLPDRVRFAASGALRDFCFFAILFADRSLEICLRLIADAL
jgi:hypothetical protein